MANHMGLYYPFIEFRDDSWVKFAALYWDKLGRIVPSGYTPRDSNTIQKLKGELDFITNIAPSDEDLEYVANLFFQLFLSHKEDLVRHYGVNSEHKVELSKAIIAGEKSIFEETLGYLKILPLVPLLGTKFMSRMVEVRSRRGELKKEFNRLKNLSQEELVLEIENNPRNAVLKDLKFSLIHEGLAVPLYIHSKHEGDKVAEMLGMNSKLAFVYMNVLAERMASVRLFNPVADDLLAHFAVNGFTFDRLVQTLLGPDSTPHLVTSPSRYEVETQMAVIALRSVLPKNIANVPIEKIIELRKNHRTEMTVFQNHIHDFAADLESLQDIDDPVALKAHLETEYEKNLKPQLNELKKILRSLNIDTIEGLMNIRVGLPPLLTTTADYIAQAHTLSTVNPIIAGAGALAFSMFPVIRKKRREIKKVVLSTPAAYLLYAQEDLEPAKLVSHITQKARKIIYSV